MVQRRVKVRVEFPRKLFYERFLGVWRDSLEDKHMRFIIYKVSLGLLDIFQAQLGLKNFPLDVDGVDALQTIHGIGELIATRLHDAWIAFSASFDPVTLETVKQAGDEVLVQLMNKKKRDRPQKISIGSKRGRDEETESTSGILTREESPVPLKASRREEVVEDDSRDEQIVTLSCLPSEKAEVILIADSRENNKRMRGKNVWEHLEKSGIRVELRPLSVGDYLWVARKIDGSELVLDYVIERKTWDDLRSSIIGGRYEEQKQRLRKANFPHRIYLIEGLLNYKTKVFLGRHPGETSCEQALMTTLVHDSFLIQRSSGTQNSANFLVALTHHLTTRVATSSLTGVSFPSLQEVVKKTQAETVRETWTRLLCVCPGMSSVKAALVASRFPSLASLDIFISSKAQPSEDLSKLFPELSKPVCSKLVQFFA